MIIPHYGYCDHYAASGTLTNHACSTFSDDVIEIATTCPQVDIKRCKIIQGMISDLSTSYGEIGLVRIYNHGTSNAED